MLRDSIQAPIAPALSPSFEIFIFVSVLVVLICVVMMTVYFRRQSAPLRDMARAASAFGHGQLNARVKVDERSPEEVQELVAILSDSVPGGLPGINPDTIPLELNTRLYRHSSMYQIM